MEGKTSRSAHVTRFRPFTGRFTLPYFFCNRNPSCITQLASTWRWKRGGQRTPSRNVLAERPNQHEYVFILDDPLSQRHGGRAFLVLLPGRILPISTMDILVFSGDGSNWIDFRLKTPNGV